MKTSLSGSRSIWSSNQFLRFFKTSRHSVFENDNKLVEGCLSSLYGFFGKVTGVLLPRHGSGTGRVTCLLSLNEQKLRECRTSKGWSYGIKLHVTINDKDEIIALEVTPGNLDDRAMIAAMTKGLKVRLFGGERR